MAAQWTQLAAADPGMLAGLLMASCRDLATMRHVEIYSAQVLKYKAECMRLLQQALVTEGAAASDLTIMKTLALASDAVSGILDGRCLANGYS